MSVDNWPKGERLQRISKRIDQYYKIFDSDDEDKSLSKEMAPIEERDWPKHLALLPMGDGTYYAASHEELEEAFEEPFDETPKRGEFVNWYDENLVDSCEICARIPTTEDSLVHCDGGHSFHHKCLTRWHYVMKDEESCPHCTKKLPVSGIVGCPVLGCRKKSYSESHMQQEHARIKCELCGRRFLKQAQEAHNFMECGTWLSVCPASGCHVELTTTESFLASINPRILLLHHNCEKIFQCQLCNTYFFCSDDIFDHAESGECTLANGVLTSRRPSRSAKRKALVDLELLSDEEDE
jgi:hypothetical protein